jgi:putative RecB family exonuclease
MKFYALVVWRTRGVMPALLQLIYLGNGEVLSYEPDEQSLLATERKIAALWAAIERATTTGQWVARKSALCGWCDHQAICPEWGGTPPPLPTDDESVEVAGDLYAAARPQSRILTVTEPDGHSLVGRLDGVEPAPGGVV